jgi:hypothetical protein
MFLETKGRSARKVHNLTAICEPTVYEYNQNVEASTSHSPMDLHGLLQGQLYLYLFSATDLSLSLSLFLASHS